MAVDRSYLLTTPVTGLDLGNLGTGDGVSEFGGIVLVIKGKVETQLSAKQRPITCQNGDIFQHSTMR